MTYEIIVGDALTELRKLDAESVQTCITSPPYYGLRDYGIQGQIGLESTPDAYVAKLVEVFREVKRVLRDDGTFWLNIGDSYASTSIGHTNRLGASTLTTGTRMERRIEVETFKGETVARGIPHGCKPKDLLGIPWMLAFALRADGWYLRSEIIWAKPNPMPESVTDRPTKAHEQVFLLSKSPRYYYDAEAIAERAQDWSRGGPGVGIQTTEHYGAGNGGNAGLAKLAQRYRGTQGASAARGVGTNPDRDNPGGGVGGELTTRNKRSVWTVATQPYPEAHFATFPPKLVEPMVLAGAPWGGVVLDPFMGSGTTLEVAMLQGRSAIGIDLNEDYAELARRRMAGITGPMFDAQAQDKAAA